MQTSRRGAIRAVGGALGGALAGCTTDGDPGDGGDGGGPGERGADGERGAHGGSDGDVRVVDAAVLPEVVAPNSPDSYGVYGERDEQYVGAHLAVDSPNDHPPASFAVRTAGEEREVFSMLGTWGGPGFGDPYDPTTRGEGSGWLAARLPDPLDAPDAALTWDGGEHAFGDAVLDRLRRPPASWDVVFEAPATADVGDEVSATVSVENTADVDGTFVAALNQVGPVIAYMPAAKVHLEVAAGETAEWKYDYTLDDRGIVQLEDPSVRFHLRWRGGSPSREVEIATG